MPAGHTLLVEAAAPAVQIPLAEPAAPAAGGRWWRSGRPSEMLAHALAGHAAAPSSAQVLNLVAQWTHLLAVGVDRRAGVAAGAVDAGRATGRPGEWCCASPSWPGSAWPWWYR